MSSDDDPSVPKKVLRTVTPARKDSRDTEMDVIGWGMFLGIVLLLVPLLPFIIIVWLLTKLFDGIARMRGES